MTSMVFILALAFVMGGVFLWLRPVARGSRHLTQDMNGQAALWTMTGGDSGSVGGFDGGSGGHGAGHGGSCGADGGGGGGHC